MLRITFVLTLVAIGVYYILWGGAYYSLLFYMGNAYFRPERWVWQADLIRSLNLSYLSALYVIIASVISRNKFILNGKVSLLILFLIHTLASALMSVQPAWAWFYWTDFLKSAVIVYMMIVLVTDFTKFRLLLFVIIMAIGIENAKQGWLYLIYPPKWESNSNTIPFLGDNNGVALGMLMLAPIILLLAQTTQRKWSRPLYWLMLGGVLARAITTYSRGAFLACLALVMIYWLRSQRKVRMLLGIVVVFAAFLPMLPQTYWDRIYTIQTYEEDGSSTGRIHFWQVAFQMANNHPLLGIGYMSYLQAYDTYDSSSGEYGERRAVHSSYFKVLAELGYVGAVLFVAILVSSLRSCSRVRKLAKQGAVSAELGKSALALEMSLVAFLVGGAFLSYAYKEIVWHFIGMTIVLDRLAAQEEAQILVSESPRRTPAAPHVSTLTGKR